MNCVPLFPLVLARALLTAGIAKKATIIRLMYAEFIFQRGGSASLCAIRQRLDARACSANVKKKKEVYMSDSVVTCTKLASKCSHSKINYFNL